MHYLAKCISFTNIRINIILSFTSGDLQLLILYWGGVSWVSSGDQWVSFCPAVASITHINGRCSISARWNHFGATVLYQMRGVPLWVQQSLQISYSSLYIKRIQSNKHSQSRYIAHKACYFVHFGFMATVIISSSMCMYPGRCGQRYWPFWYLVSTPIFWYEHSLSACPFTGDRQ